MTEVLSQQDLDQLLQSIESLEDSLGSEVDVADSIAEKQIQLYNFRKPDRFSKDQLRTIEIMHETFSRLLMNTLSGQMRTLVDVHVASVYQIIYEEFVKTIPTPTTYAIVDMQPLSGSAIIEVDPAITFNILNRFFGGSGGSTLNRELTEIEISVVENIINMMLRHLREAWSRIISLKPNVMQIETNPLLAQVVPPNEMMLMILFNCRIDDIEGLINIAIPYITIEPVIPKLTAHTWYSSASQQSTEDEVKGELEELINKAEIDLVAELNKSSLTMNEIVSLEKGDIIYMENFTKEQKVRLRVGQTYKFLASPGRSGAQKAIKVLEPIEQEDLYKYMSQHS